MEISQVRKLFVDFFEKKGHTFVPSSSLIPHQDPTILFTIAGMAQFKDALTGAEKRSYSRATNFQKCLRVGDLEDVGQDGRHLTFFEMLGSWSFGDYYKHDAILWARELALDVLRFPLDKLWVTVHHSDLESEEIWKSAGITGERIRRLGDKDNFWAMGPTGPCGPCSELYVDQGPKVGKCTDKTFDCKAGPGCDCDRYLEFWNLVFMQFDKQPDGSLKELPMKSVDTGAGLERVSALLQGKTNVFEIDSFVNLKKGIANVLHLGSLDKCHPFQITSLNVVADHIRTLVFTLADGAHFSAEGRGYVLRRVLRRAVHHVHKLNSTLAKKGNILSLIAPQVVELFQEAYPELPENLSRVQEQLALEEGRFIQTLESGLEKFHQFAKQAQAKGQKVLEGADVFVLHDSFGFPSDLTRVLCQELGLGVDLEAFEKLMEAQRQRARGESKFYAQSQMEELPWIAIGSPKSDDSQKGFVGYQFSQVPVQKEGVLCYEVPGSPSDLMQFRSLDQREGELILGTSPFYPEGGGQVSDVGFIRFETPTLGCVTLDVAHVQKTKMGLVHRLQGAAWGPMAQEEFKSVKNVSYFVNRNHRLFTQRNHTATHLLHKALREVCGTNVVQNGSLVQPSGLRFDFTMPRALSKEEILQIQELVNEQIRLALPVVAHENVHITKAKEMGAMALFGEKYTDSVRVLDIEGFSKELCGGCHVRNTSEIGVFKIISESSVTSGVRRIEAITGEGILQAWQRDHQILQDLCASTKAPLSELTNRVDQFKETQKELERQLSKWQSEWVNAQIPEWVQKESVWLTSVEPPVRFLAKKLPIQSPEVLELAADRLRDKGVDLVLLGCVDQDRIHLISSCSDNIPKRFAKLTAGNLLKVSCESLGGKGGGRPTYAKGQAPVGEGTDNWFSLHALAWVKERLV